MTRLFSRLVRCLLPIVLLAAPGRPTRRRARPSTPTAWRRKAARTCSSTPTTRSTGTRGAPEAFEKAKKEKQARLPLDRLQLLPLVPRHGARVVRQRGGRQDPQRALRLHQGGPRGAARRRPHLHDRPATSCGQRGGWPLSMFLTARRQADRRRHLLAARGQEGRRRERSAASRRILQARARAGHGQAQGARGAGRQDRRGDDRRRSTGAGRGIALVELEPRAGRRRGRGAEGASSTRSTAASAAPTRKFRGHEVPARRRVWSSCCTQAQRDQGRGAGRAWSTLTLDKMAQGGIYDHLGGGFHRYSTERTWTVPHFEKMLYDNAQLVELYAEAYRVDQEAALPPRRARRRWRSSRAR